MALDVKDTNPNKFCMKCNILPGPTAVDPSTPDDDLYNKYKDGTQIQDVPKAISAFMDKLAHKISMIYRCDSSYKDDYLYPYMQVQTLKKSLFKFLDTEKNPKGKLVVDENEQIVAVRNVLLQRNNPKLVFFLVVPDNRKNTIVRPGGNT